MDVDEEVGFVDKGYTAPTAPALTSMSTQVTNTADAPSEPDLLSEGEVACLVGSLTAATCYACHPMTIVCVLA